MNDKSSAYEIVKSHAADMQVCLYTPAHQGLCGESSYFSEQIYGYDFPFLTRSRTEGVEKFFSKLYQTKHTFFLTNGATQGILAAFALLANKHQTVAIALNSHISVVHGLILSGLKPFFIPSNSLMPTADEVIHALETGGKEVGAIVLTHPSYEGITTDIKKVSQYCKLRHINLIIDEAHGSHFPFLQGELNSAIEEGADLVIHSLHKYVGSFVQTALLHLPQNSNITVEQMITALSLFENTTRSNLLILSIEESIQKALGDEGKALFVKASNSCNKLRNKLDNFGTVLSYDAKVNDPLKLFLTSNFATGDELGKLLLHEGVDYEYSDERGVLLIFSFQHTEADFICVSKALDSVNQILSHKQSQTLVDESYFSHQPIMRVLPRDAFFASSKQRLSLKEAKGKISCSCLKKIPPGIPILIPGEEVTDWHIQHLPSDTVIEVIKN